MVVLEFVVISKRYGVIESIESDVENSFVTLEDGRRFLGKDIRKKAFIYKTQNHGSINYYNSVARYNLCHC